MGTTMFQAAPLSDRQSGALAIRRYASRALMGAAAAADVADALRTGLARKSEMRMIFAAAPSQSDMLEALCRLDGIDWHRVTAFHMDEYLGLPASAPQRFAAWLDAHLFRHLNFGAVHRIAPETDKGEGYANLLAAAPIDIVCLGIGVNGHIAFNDPPVADFNDPLDVKTVELDAICRQQQVDDGSFARLAAVPTHAITLTIPRLLRADRLFCVVPGAQKRQAVHDTLHGPISLGCPASILRTHPACVLYLDPESDPDA